MKQTKKSKKISFESVIKEVPAIKHLYNELLTQGFTTEQAYGLTQTIITLVLK